MATWTSCYANSLIMDLLDNDFGALPIEQAIYLLIKKQFNTTMRDNGHEGGEKGMRGEGRESPNDKIVVRAFYILRSKP